MSLLLKRQWVRRMQVPGHVRVPGAAAKCDFLALCRKEFKVSHGKVKMVLFRETHTLSIDKSVGHLRR